MADAVAPEFVRFVQAERRAGRLPTARRQLAAGELADRISIEQGRAPELLRVAAKRAAGFFRPTKRAEVVWVQGDSELAIDITKLDIHITDGLMIILLPVRCDQTGAVQIEVAFAVGSANEPAGLYASAYRRPNGPPLITEAWGESLIAFAWQAVLGMISGIAGATGKDARGNILVPVEFSASEKGLEITPMARHRFVGSSGLLATRKTPSTKPKTRGTP